MPLQNSALDVHHDTAALTQGSNGVGGPSASLENGKERIGVIFEEMVFGGDARVEFPPLLQPVEEGVVLETFVKELAVAEVLEGKVPARVMKFGIDVFARAIRLFEQ